MEATYQRVSVRAFLDILVSEAVSADVPSPIAEEIAVTTARRLSLDPRRRADAQDRRRLAAYYREVVRRRTMDGSAGPRAVARMIAASVVEDLRLTGRDGRSIFDHLRRGWSERIPPDVLEEYRATLCG